MNLPNQLTIGRLFLTAFFVAALSLDFPYAKTAALLLFSIAAITDFLDGYLARKHNLITDFGKLMDPLADKVLMASGFVMLCSMESTRSLFPAWIVIAILAREFMVTGLRLVAAAEGKVLAAEKLGKHKTIWQIITVIYFLTFLASEDPGLQWLDIIFDSKLLGPTIVGNLLIAATLILTVWSGIGYLWKNKSLLKDM
ncbi:MAG: CDP-diacylglycerol--glycerol-3-phosphate 3-phosphatidyltransferase [Verrucomicrobiales bacterium]|nr:CDP-diacylglycerol--glycerol-3-phosphate 3-phosphatidyltransferase [Verrucomicrobiales bacterium]